MDLSEIRKEIDNIDSQLIELFKKRMECSRQVANYKKATNTSIMNLKREQEILDKVEEQGGEFGCAAQLLFSNILELSRGLQHDIIGSGKEIRKEIGSAKNSINKTKDVKIALQGIVGSNSHEATTKLFPDCQPIFYRSFAEVFEAVNNGEADYGVLPVENSSAGSVADVYDLILQYRFYIVKALDLPIEHCLCSIKQSELSDIEQVWSHPQALAQCTEFINNHNFATVPSPNTAIAAMDIAKEKRLNCAAICTEKAAQEYGLKVLAKGCQNEKDNSTRFIVISKELIIPDDADKVSLCFSVPHIKGSLYNVLGRFSSNGMNLTKIESRPRDGVSFEYLFYLDFQGSVHSDKVMNMLCALSEEMPEFSFLGNYKED
ncbi:MAG: prephenate dehydratase [Acutalibacteraceae bacterium]|nr:prephenate dehydratase [Acutalibacteraceae bacterium]